MQEDIFDQGPPVKARICIGKENVIMECNAKKNIFGSLYHVREPHTKIHDLPFSAALQHLQQWNDRGIMIKVRLRSIISFQILVCQHSAGSKRCKMASALLHHKSIEIIG